MIAKATRSEYCILGIADFGRLRPTLTPEVCAGRNSAAVHMMQSCLEPLRRRPLGTVAIADFHPDAEQTDDRSPESIAVASSRVLDIDQRSLVFAACRSGRRGYGSTEERFFKRLAPRLCRLMAAANAARLLTTKTSALEAMFDALATGVFLADCDARILYANAAARRLSDRGQWLSVRGGRLVSPNRISNASLRNAIETCVNRRYQASENRMSIVLGCAEGQDLIATIVPLSRRRGIEVLDTGTVGVFVKEPDSEPLIPGEGFAKLYQLTSCELSLLLSMLPGLCVKEVAKAQGISEATARSHLHHLFMKTGTRNQVELMRLFSSYALPVLAEPDCLRRDRSHLF